MTRAEQIIDLLQQIAETPKHKRKTLSLLEARVRSLMTRQIAAEHKNDRKQERAA